MRNCCPPGPATMICWPGSTELPATGRVTARVWYSGSSRWLKHVCADGSRSSSEPSVDCNWRSDSTNTGSVARAISAASVWRPIGQVGTRNCGIRGQELGEHVIGGRAAVLQGSAATVQRVPPMLLPFLPTALMVVLRVLSGVGWHDR